MGDRHDIIVTWPKSRAFGSYMVHLEDAKTHGQLVNFRVPHLPNWRELIEDHGSTGFVWGADIRCYRVHDGEVRGWLKVLDARWLPGGRVLDPVTGSFMKPGNYIVCDPEWHPATKRAPMTGFRGWRWFDRKTVGDAWPSSSSTR